MQEKNVPNEKKPVEGQEIGKQGGQGDVGKKGGDIGGDLVKELPKKGDHGDMGKTGEVGKNL